MNIHWLYTQDGAKLAIYRFGHQSRKIKNYPILMISGYGLNARALNLNERFSWAKKLAENGYDVWILELRGSGTSTLANGSDGSFDDYIGDALLGLQYVLEQTKNKQVHWIGYSLGGMLLYSLLSLGHDQLIKSGVGIEAPLHLKNYPINPRLLKLAEKFYSQKLIKTKVVPYHMIGRVLAPVAHYFYGTKSFSQWMNLENMEKNIIKDLLRQTFDDVPIALILQFSLWAREEQFLSLDKKTNYLLNLHKVNTPLFIVRGDGDFAQRAKWPVDQLSFRVQEMNCLKSEGFSADYGHSDLIFGIKAMQEVFVPVLHWLNIQDDRDEISAII